MLTLQKKNAKLISNDYRDYAKSLETNLPRVGLIERNLIHICIKRFSESEIIDFDSIGKSSDKDSVENDATLELEDEVKIQSENKSNETISINDTQSLKL